MHLPFLSILQLTIGRCCHPSVNDVSVHGDNIVLRVFWTCAQHAFTCKQKCKNIHFIVAFEIWTNLFFFFGFSMIVWDVHWFVVVVFASLMKSRQSIRITITELYWDSCLNAQAHKLYLFINSITFYHVTCELIYEVEITSVTICLTPSHSGASLTKAAR